MESRLSDRKLKPLPPDPFRHQNSAIAPAARRNRSIGRGRLQEYNHPGAILGRCEPAIMLHVVAGHNLIGFRDEAIELLLVPYKIRALHSAGIAVVRKRTGFPSDDIVEVRAQAIVAFLGRMAGDVWRENAQEKKPRRSDLIPSHTSGKARIDAPMREARSSPRAHRGARVIGRDAAYLPGIAELRRKARAGSETIQMLTRIREAL